MSGQDVLWQEIKRVLNNSSEPLDVLQIRRKSKVLQKEQPKIITHILYEKERHSQCRKQAKPDHYNGNKKPLWSLKAPNHGYNNGHNNGHNHNYHNISNYNNGQNYFHRHHNNVYNNNNNHHNSNGHSNYDSSFFFNHLPLQNMQKQHQISSPLHSPLNSPNNNHNDTSIVSPPMAYPHRNIQSFGSSTNMNMNGDLNGNMNGNGYNSHTFNYNDDYKINNITGRGRGRGRGRRSGRGRGGNHSSARIAAVDFDQYRLKQHIPKLEAINEQQHKLNVDAADFVPSFQSNARISSLIDSDFREYRKINDTEYILEEYYAKKSGQKYYRGYLYHIYIDGDINHHKTSPFGLLLPRQIPNDCLSDIQFPIQLVCDYENQYKQYIERNKNIDNANKAKEKLTFSKKR